MAQVKENIDQALDKVWEANKSRIQRTDIGTYLDVDNLTIRDAGLSAGDLVSPGGLSTWRNQPGGSRYFMQSFGPGRTRLFRK